MSASMHRDGEGRLRRSSAPATGPRRLDTRTSPRVSATLDELATRAAASDSTLLLTGETGVGKGRLARMIHDAGRRADGPFVPVNCGAIPEGLIDSQLFGHARGSFSGAGADHPGLVRAAAGGTLLLDEVGELPAPAQVRLLRLLEEREVQPVGYPRPVTVDVRIIAASNRDLSELVEAGAFRRDLYFRLDILRLHVPSLRERTGEIPRLLEEFNREFAALYGRDRLRFDAEAMAALLDHSWPGNVRELRSLVERLHILHPQDEVGTRQVERLGRLGSAGNGRRPDERRWQQSRRELAREALRAAGGNVRDAAAELGVHRSTVYRWLSDSGASD